jgi:hypothetical protein
MGEGVMAEATWNMHRAQATGYRLPSTLFRPTFFRHFVPIIDPGSGQKCRFCSEIESSERLKLENRVKNSIFGTLRREGGEKPAKGAMGLPGTKSRARVGVETRIGLPPGCFRSPLWTIGEGRLIMGN